MKLKILFVLLFVSTGFSQTSSLNTIPCTDNVATTVVTNDGSLSNWVSNVNTNTFYSTAISSTPSFLFDVYIQMYQSEKWTEEIFTIDWYQAFLNATPGGGIYELVIGLENDGGGTPANNEFWFYREPSTDEWVFVGQGASDDVLTKKTTDHAPSANTWYHYQLIIDATQSPWDVDLFVDGTKLTWAAWSAGTLAAAAFNDTLWVGSKTVHEPDAYFHDIRFYVPDTTNYYVDIDNGNNDYTGHSIYTPLLDFDSLNTVGITLEPGDSVLQRTGTTIRQQLTVPASGSAGLPITFTCYDSATGLTGSDAVGDLSIIDGRDVITGLTPSDVFVSAWNRTQGSAANGSDDRQRRMLINGLSDGGDSLKIALKVGDANTTIDGTGIGLREGTGNTGDDYQTGSAVRITWAGEDTVAIASGAIDTSDAILFTTEVDSSYLIHMFWDDQYSYAFANPGAPDTTWTSNGGGQSDESLTESISYGISPGYTFCITDVFVNQLNVYMKTLATEPDVVTFNDTIGYEESSVANLNTDKEWAYSGGNLYIYATDTTTIEAGQRDGCITINDKDYIVIDGLHLKGASKGGVYIHSSSENITVRNCDASLNNSGVRLGWNAGHTHTIDSNNFYNNRFGLWLWGHTQSGSGTEVTISNNNVYENYSQGLYIYGNWSIIENNTIYDNGDSRNLSIGILIFDDGDTTKGQYNIVRYNKVSNTVSLLHEGTGIECDQYTNNNQVYYNYCFNNDGPGLSNINSFSNAFYNNTLYGNNQYSGAGSPTLAEIFVLGNNFDLSDSLIFINNICFPTVAAAYAIYIDDDSYDDSLTFSNNLYNKSAAGDWWFWNATGGTDISVWNDSTNAPSGTDLYGDPLFTDAANADFNLQSGSPAIDKAIDWGQTGDFDNNSKFGSAWDIGAFESQVRLRYENRFSLWPEWPIFP